MTYIPTINLQNPVESLSQSIRVEHDIGVTSGILSDDGPDFDTSTLLELPNRAIINPIEFNEAIAQTGVDPARPVSMEEAKPCLLLATYDGGWEYESWNLYDIEDNDTSWILKMSSQSHWSSSALPSTISPTKTKTNTGWTTVRELTNASNERAALEVRCLTTTTMQFRVIIDSNVASDGALASFSCNILSFGS